MTDRQVLIAGAGPTGLMLAAELKIAGIDVAIVERRNGPQRIGPGALGMHPRTLELLDQRGIVERFLAEGTRHSFVHFHVPLDISDFPSRHACTLALRQPHIERLMMAWVDELGVPIHWGMTVADVSQHAQGVDVTLGDAQIMGAEYLVGCDGGRSAVRKAVGIGFPGTAPSMSWLISEIMTRDEPRWGFHSDASGTHAIGRAEEGAVTMVLAEAQLHTGDAPTLQELRETLMRVYGTDFGIHDPRWISRFTDATRQAETYRDRRVLLAGDAAHVHPPQGGQGLNIGVQDAMNLGWKLAQVVHGHSPAELLDTYHAERHPVGAQLMRNAMAQVALGRTDPRTRALGEVVSEIFRMDAPRCRLAGMMSGLDVNYEPGAGHPLLGRRIPDLDLHVEGVPARLYSLLRDARWTLIEFEEPDSARGVLSHGLVKQVFAQHDGPLVLPVLGAVITPTAVLVRPDGHVAWVGCGSREGLSEALRKWCGDHPGYQSALPR